MSYFQSSNSIFDVWLAVVRDQPADSHNEFSQELKAHSYYVYVGIYVLGASGFMKYLVSTRSLTLTSWYVLSQEKEGSH